MAIAADHLQDARGADLVHRIELATHGHSQLFGQHKDPPFPHPPARPTVPRMMLRILSTSVPSESSGEWLDSIG
jgi:hypothetical protein